MVSTTPRTWGSGLGAACGAVYDAGYGLALKAMFMLPPERIHLVMSAALRALHAARPVNRALRAALRIDDPVLEQTVFGVTFPAPLGLAAGFDKNASAADAWGAVGFGYAELGTVTPKPQPGNPRPRLYRLPKDKAILNRMGFNNDGALTVASHLRARRSGDVVGINIGKNKTSADAVADYRACASALGGLADYLVVNVSSPNTPGLRDLQAIEELRPILEVVTGATSTPVLVKIAPDLSDADIDAVADLALELGLAGIVATNTTISRDNLATDPAEVAAMGSGGISGEPLHRRSLEVLRRLHARVGGKLALISVGGITTPERAWERIAAGASLLQGYTPFIYGGPGWIRRIHVGLAAQVKAHGLGTISEAVGSGLGWVEPS
ncbi:quinone-dependent dihydroorotate dehydrogenase [Corynebacterium liangguodongii]|uniref:Dihydroorotate dehydrogenase (quinone) n=1 Tax=Corynebacterium liangguodongii TaxID=2079535 RepID=A0A2S0WE44_9CORY|nr:quinone-dependent dihydroorotate dehydrogenase [Corynebacterium liangguodongii]AWB84020.1 dihydroorotate dehydrogenase (quinone) [Corynebacterium liangguodongii]PWC00032.1 quinone-dependent dihydroorotate dehydrogenase [Corynebacterium liangguodongii]